MNDLTDDLYNALLKAADGHCLAEVFDCGDHLEVEDLANEKTLFTVTLMPDNADRNRALCQRVADNVNTLSRAVRSEELEHALKTCLIEFVQANDYRTLH